MPSPLSSPRTSPSRKGSRVSFQIQKNKAKALETQSEISGHESLNFVMGLVNRSLNPEEEASLACLAEPSPLTQKVIGEGLIKGAPSLSRAINKALEDWKTQVSNGCPDWLSRIYFLGLKDLTRQFRDLTPQDLESEIQKSGGPQKARDLIRGCLASPDQEPMLPMAKHGAKYVGWRRQEE